MFFGKPPVLPIFFRTLKLQKEMETNREALYNLGKGMTVIMTQLKKQNEIQLKGVK